MAEAKPGAAQWGVEPPHQQGPRINEMQTRPSTTKTFTAYVEWDPETELYVGTVPGITGAHTQAATLGELQHNLKEVLQLCLEEDSIEPPKFVGIQQIQIDV
jgi:predicted RNase H-like HicB family nuclease